MLENKNIDLNQYVKSFFSGNGLDLDNAPSWLPKANFSRTQTDLIATSPEGEQVVLLIILLILIYRIFKLRMVYYLRAHY